MADEGIFATTAEVERKAGAGASSVSKAEAYVNQYMAEAESDINVAITFNFSENYSTLNEEVRDILKDCASCLAAIMVIQYDLSGFTSRLEAEDMINVLRDRALFLLGILKDKKQQDFINKEAV